LQGELSLSKG
jgi:hypothetical protein